MKNLRKNLWNFQSELKEQGIFFCFSGPISQKILNGIVKNLKNRKELEDTKKVIMNRTITAIIELLQNVIYYSTEPQGVSDVGDGILIIGKENDCFSITCGNPINREKALALEPNLKKLLKMSKNDIKKYYIEQLENTPDEESRGAGLGFIGLAKKSSRPFEYDMISIDDNVDYFSITIFI